MYEDACKVFKTILKINPDYYRSYLGIGICFDKLGESAKAKRYYRKYLNLKPEAYNFISVKNRLISLLPDEPVKKNFLKIV